MGRAERRAKEKAKKKDESKKVEALAWLRSLPPVKQALIDSLVKIEAKKENDYLLQAIDRCFSAAVIQEFDFLEWNEIERIIDKSAELMLDDAHKMKDLKESLGGSYDMAIKKVNEMGPEVEKRIRELIKEGYNQKISVKMLLEEFRELSTAMVTNAYKKTKALMAEEENIKNAAEVEAENIENKLTEVLGEPDKIIENAVEYIFEDEKEVEKAKNEDDENNEDEDFEILKEVRILDIKGKYGQYHIEKSTVEINKLSFVNEDEVRSWADDEREELLREIESLKLKVKNITLQEKEILKVMDKFVK